MEKVTIIPPAKHVNGWIDPSYIPEGKDKYYIRNKQVSKPKGGWRHLTSDEIERLVKNMVFVENGIYLDNIYDVKSFRGAIIRKAKPSAVEIDSFYISKYPFIFQ